MIGNATFYILQKSIASAEDSDKALKLGLYHPMEPFELVDLVGLHTGLYIVESEPFARREVSSCSIIGAAREGRSGTEKPDEASSNVPRSAKPAERRKHAKTRH